MRTHLSIFATTLLLISNAVAQAGGQVTCVPGNSVPPGTGSVIPYTNDTGHISGSHILNAFHNGSCSYTANGGQQNICLTQLSAGDIPSGSDSGITTEEAIGFFHVEHFTQVGASAANVGAVNATARAAVAVEDCFLAICGFGVSILADGVTVKVDSGSPIWTAEDNFGAYCPQSYSQYTPIIIDTDGKGFHLTNVAGGVETDMVYPGHRMQFSWTARGSTNAFLWLDNHLFGNTTPQPPSNDPNGFRALAVYDSNGDGVIDAKDPVFPRLRLWIDANHDGVAQADELYMLDKMGVDSISLKYWKDSYTDQFGNRFRYRGRLVGDGRVDRTVYDIILNTN